MKALLRGLTTFVLVDFLLCTGGAPAQVCVGDCNGDGQVTVDEIVACVGIALHVASVESCAACDPNVDGSVRVDELVTSVSIGIGSLRLSACTELACLDSGGLDTFGSCCIGAGDFPNTCSIGVCSCAPEFSEQVRMCECPSERCFDGDRCVPLATQDCLDSGGTVSLASCCLSAGDFPDTCAIGACSCSPKDSHVVRVCECPAGRCFDGLACTPIAQQACLESGGSVASRSCCRGVGDFPDTCAVGACGCSPEQSEAVLVCNCPLDQCFDGRGCVPTSLP